jgi:hypothetical protein
MSKAPLPSTSKKDRIGAALRASSKLVCCTFVLGLGGCMQYLVQPPAPSIAGNPHALSVNSYAGGTVQQPPYVLASKCLEGEQLARVLVKRNFGQGLISWLTLGLYSPATVVYECANAGEPGLGHTGASGDQRR